MDFEKLSTEDLETSKEDFGTFLDEQIQLPKEQWSEKFLQHINDVRDKQREFEKHKSPEAERTERFELALQSLGLHIENIKDKKILDIACGEDANFVLECLEEGITNDVYGLDQAIDPERFAQYKEHFFRASFEEDLPVAGLDYALSTAALGFGEGHLSPSTKGFLQAIDTLKEGGELRLGPFDRRSFIEGESKVTNFHTELEHMAKEIAEKNNCDFSLIPTELHVSQGTGEYLWLREVLIFKKK